MASSSPDSPVTGSSDEASRGHRPETKNANVEIIAWNISENNTDNSDYRLLVDKDQIKYVTVLPGTSAENDEDRALGPVLLGQLLSALPAGDWNLGMVGRDPLTGKPTFLETHAIERKGVQNAWHHVKLSELDFTLQDRLRPRVHVSTHPALNNGEPVLVKLENWPQDIARMETETTAYQLIDGSRIGPKFLGHIREGRDGRVIGFATELVQPARDVNIGDMHVCFAALRNLHDHGIAYGTIQLRNFLVRDSGEVVLIDFAQCSRTTCNDGKRWSPAVAR